MTCDTHDVVTSPEMDRILDILSKRERRVILRLLKRDGARNKTDLLSRGGDVLDGGATALHHVHLPRLEAAGYVEWDRETGEIATGSRYDEAESILTLLEAHADELPLD
jgi:hypothetical protein